MNAGPAQFAILSAIIFSIGLYGVLVRRTTAGILMALVVLTSGPVIALVGFTHLGQSRVSPATGDALAFLAIVAAAAEGLAGAAVAALLWRRERTLDVDELAGIEA